MTGENGREYVLINRSRMSCVLDARPRVALYASGRRLLFRVGPGDGNYVSKALPRPVALRPGGAGYFLVAKYRCDAGAAADSTHVVVVIGERQPALGIDGAPADFGFCRRFPGAHGIDPGNQIEVSAVEASPQATIG